MMNTINFIHSTLTLIKIILLSDFMSEAETAISFQPLSGALSETPYAYFIRVDGFGILLDCGWPETFKIKEIQNRMIAITQIDAVLISHAALENCGSLPYLVRKRGCSSPIYAIHPVTILALFVYMIIPVIF
jgi:Cft2 family RNA processing exonuclease